MVGGRQRCLNPMKYKRIYFLSLLLFTISLKSAASAVAQRQSSSTLITESDFNRLFPLRNKFYTYTAFIQAVQELKSLDIQVETKGPFLIRMTRKDKNKDSKVVVREDVGWNEAWAQDEPRGIYDIPFGDFCNNANTSTNKKELAAFFAQVAHETRNGKNGEYNDGLMLLAELTPSSDYSTASKIYPAVLGKNYYGRGPLQLSYNGNYGFISDCIFGNKSILLNNPDELTTNAVTSFKSAICFWMMPQGSKPSAHQVMTGKWVPTADDKIKGRAPGFGMVINIINGTLECNQGEDQQNMRSRIAYYRAFLTILNVADPNCACSCGTMQPY